MTIPETTRDGNKQPYSTRCPAGQACACVVGFDKGSDGGLHGPSIQETGKKAAQEEADDLKDQTDEQFAEDHSLDSFGSSRPAPDPP